MASADTGSSAHSKLIIASNTSELHALCASMSAHDNKLHGFFAELAAVMRKELPKEIERRGGSRQAFGGLDAKYSARQVAKPFQEIAKLHQETARLYVVGYTRYQERVLNISPKGGGSGGWNADQ